jgi:hypothetical protein
MSSVLSIEVRAAAPSLMIDASFGHACRTLTARRTPVERFDTGSGFVLLRLDSLAHDGC